MRVKVRLFAALREAVGKAELEYDMPSAAQVKDVLSTLAERHPSLRDRLGFVQVAVNREYASPETELRDGDEVALVPPVGGG